MSTFLREQRKINGLDTVIYAAGEGDPLVIFHGAGTAEGFDFAEPLTDRFRVIFPYHPGFGESADDPRFTDIHDYVMHYLELFDDLGLGAFHLLGLSFGGFLASKFTSEHGHRVKKLVLIAPAGMLDEKHPMADILAIPVEKLLPMLVYNFDALKKRLPETPGPDFIRARAQEATTYARLMAGRPYDWRLPAYLHRVSAPALVLWGEEDKIVPVQHAELWKKYLPAAWLTVFKDAGHLVQIEKPEAVEEIARFLR